MISLRGILHHQLDSFCRRATSARTQAAQSSWFAWGAFPLLLLVGCATRGDLDAVRVEVTSQVSSLRNDLDQTRQNLDTIKTDIALLKTLGVTLETLRGRVETMQDTVTSLQTEADSHRNLLGTLHGDVREVKVAHEGVARETDRLRVAVGSLE